jgi:hypothetical protein
MQRELKFWIGKHLGPGGQSHDAGCKDYRARVTIDKRGKLGSPLQTWSLATRGNSIRVEELR